MREDWVEILYKDAVFKVSTVKHKLKQSEYLPKGAYRVVDQGQSIIGGYTNSKESLLECNLPVIVFGDHTKKIKLIDFKFAPGADGTKVLEPKSGVDPKYISLLTEILVFKIKDKGYARHYQHIEKQYLPLPSVPEQRVIVSKIETLFSDLDKGIADLNLAKEQLKVYRQAVLKKAFEGELTREWREENNPTPSYDLLKKISKERKINKPPKDSIYHKKITHDFDFSKSESISTWSVGTLDKLVYIAARIGWRGLKKSEYTDDGPLFLSVHSLNHGKYVDYSEAYHLSEERYLESPEIQLIEGDVLLCKDGAGIGKIGIVKNLNNKATVNSSILVIRGLEILDQDFIYYLFSGPDLQSIVFERITGSATPHLFQNDIRKFKLQIPPKEEQHQIVREIESRLSVCDKVEQNITEALEKSEALRQSILKKAFEGKLLSKAEIDKCKQEADYEPASVLLERIKKEKKKK
ncbi:restriction endonuclease subunit S [Carboxylicivirga caseinilyticus]|uniref:restriction endonuclease subunit S n=1 Tax=Carboxylicivirga caseinilyticus TaxID=3417572 RepID=UPI003D337111|nr:restriction endonuclease subunit S [Marinilabiliaceae bacterium A049]